MAEGSEYCKGCGGKVSGMTVDYSQMRKKVGDVYDASSSEPLVSDGFDEVDERFANQMWLRFTMFLFIAPFFAVMFLISWLVEKETDYMYLGVFFLAISVLMIALAFKYFRGGEEVKIKESKQSPPSFLRRI